MKQILDQILSSPQFPEGTAWCRRYYSAGEKIIEKGELGDSLYLLEKGNVRVLGEAEIEGNVRVVPGLCDLEQGALFGDVCLYSGHRRTASVKALSDVCVLEINSKKLTVYLDAHPEQGYLFLKSLFEIMSTRLALANERIDRLLAWGIKAHDIDKYL